MHITHLTLKNFKGFEHREFHFPCLFSLVIGTNGMGKTSALDALAVALGSWFLGIRDYEKTRHIRAEEIRLARHKYDGEIRFEESYPVVVEATGQLSNSSSLSTWSRSLSSPKGRTTYVDAKVIRDKARVAEEQARKGESVVLPVISYYGTGRLWMEPRMASQVKTEKKLAGQRRMSRLEGYRNSIDPRLSVRELIQWIARQSWISYQQGKESDVFRTVKKAILGCVDGADNMYFDPKRGEVVVVMRAQGAQPFANLSDGQRSMLALVGDIAQKAAKLNPHLGRKVLEQSPGVVLIDELDLHLHPQWQRRVIGDLRRTFPAMQFVCTTHSPFLIQSLRVPSELIMLDGQPLSSFGNRSIDEITRDVMGVVAPQTSQEYGSQLDLARQALATLEQPNKSAAQRKAAFDAVMAAAPEHLNANPALGALLQLRRIAQTGS